jgi:chitin synthase
MYRLRSAEKGRPLLISNEVILEYSDGEVDTLHKKNLLSLGEDRYLTTLMTKHFPNMSYKFVPDALAHTAAPDKWSILLSQRRRWINSTIHNLAELVFLKDMCGFCCFSMRFVVFIDLFGTIILPATCAYLGYLLYRVGTHSGQFPLVSLIMLAAVYGLQAVIFIVKRQWQHIGWMVIYIIAFPIYSFVLPIYSFWKQDDFSWGNTRMVVEEKGGNKVVAIDKHDEGFDPRSIPLQRWDDYAAANGLPGRRNLTYSEKVDGVGFDEMEMDELRSEYSFGRKPPSTVYSGYNPQRASAVPLSAAQRNSMYSMSNRNSQMPANLNMAHQRPNSSGNVSNADGLAIPRPVSTVYNPSGDNLNPSAANLRARQSMAFSTGPSRPVSTVNFMDAPRTGPTDEDITTAVREALVNVELDKVTKKQLMALAEMKLQSQLPVERRAFMNAIIDRELEMMDD